MVDVLSSPQLRPSTDFHRVVYHGETGRSGIVPRASSAQTDNGFSRASLPKRRHSERMEPKPSGISSAHASNRRNALRSTGPRPPEGASRQARGRHGSPRLRGIRSTRYERGPGGESHRSRSLHRGQVVNHPSGRLSKRQGVAVEGTTRAGSVSGERFRSDART